MCDLNSTSANELFRVDHKEAILRDETSSVQTDPFLLRSETTNPNHWDEPRPSVREPTAEPMLSASNGRPPVSLRVLDLTEVNVTLDVEESVLQVKIRHNYTVKAK